MTTPTYDLFRLNDDMLHLANDEFYEFVVQVAGELEANNLKKQGIGNVRSLLRSSDRFSVFKLDCDELYQIKREAFWQCNNGDYVIKQGIELNFQILQEVLKDKHDKYVRKIYQRKRSSVPVFDSSMGTATKEADPTDDESSRNTSSSVNPKSSFTPSSGTTGSSIALDHTQSSLVSDIDAINALIDKYSRKSFMSTILKYNDHYRLSFAQENQRTKAVPHCQCGTRLSLFRRDQSSSFILSNYYAHLSHSDCAMMKRILTIDRRTGWDQSPTSSVTQTGPLAMQLNGNDTTTTSTDISDSSTVASDVQSVAIQENSKKRKSDRFTSSSRRDETTKKRVRKPI